MAPPDAVDHRQRLARGGCTNSPTNYAWSQLLVCRHRRTASLSSRLARPGHLPVTASNAAGTGNTASVTVTWVQPAQPPCARCRRATLAGRRLLGHLDRELHATARRATRGPTARPHQHVHASASRPPGARTFTVAATNSAGTSAPGTSRSPGSEPAGCSLAREPDKRAGRRAGDADGHVHATARRLTRGLENAPPSGDMHGDERRGRAARPTA